MIATPMPASEPVESAAPLADRLRARRAELLVALAIVVSFGRELFTPAYIYARDIGHYILPLKRWWRAEVLSGHFPQWLPNVGLGAPYLADPGNQAFYPLQLLLLLPLPGSLDLFLVVHVLIAGIGAVALARRLGLDEFGSAVAGLGFATGGYIVSMTTSGLYLCGAAYLPAVVAAMLVVARPGAPLAAHARLGALLALQLLAGDFQALIFSSGLGTLLVLALPADVEADTAAAGVTRRLRALSRCLPGLALGSAIGAVQVLPALRYAAQSARGGGLSLEDTLHFSTHPLRLLNLVIVQPFGDPMLGPYHGGALERPPYDIPWAFSLYASAALLLLAPAALLGGDRRSRRMAGVLLVLALVGLGLSLGAHAPLYGWAHVGVPLFSMFRYPEKCAAVASLLLALLAGFGARAAFRLSEQRALRTLSLALVPALLLLPLAFSAPLRRALVAPLALEGATLADAVARLGGQSLLTLCVVVAVALSVWVRRKGLFLAIYALDLVVAAALVQAPAELQADAPAPELLARARAGLAAHDPARLYDVRGFFYGPKTADFETLYVLTAKPNRGIAAGLHHLQPYSAAASAAGSRLLYLLDRIPLRLGRIASATAFVGDEPRYQKGVFGDGPVAARWGPLVLVDHPDPLPRAYAVRAQLTVPDDATAEAVLFDERFPADRVAVLTGEAVAGVARHQMASAPPPPLPCRMLDYAADTVAFECTVDRPAIAVLTDQWSPGWGLEVDGRAAPVHRVQLAFRGAALGAGTHRLVYRYRTPGLWAGALISLLGAAALSLVWRRGRRRGAQATSS